MTGSIWLVNHSGIGDPLRAPEELSLLHRSAGPNSNPIRSHKGNPRPAPVTAYAIVAPEPAEEGVTPAPLDARDHPAETDDWPELAAAWERFLAEDLAGM